MHTKNYISHYRSLGGFSTPQLADLAGIAKTTLYRLEAGAEGKYDTLAAVAKVLGVSVDEMMNGPNPIAEETFVTLSGQAIREVREKLGMSVRGLASQLGISVRAMEGIEEDVIQAEEEYAERVADTLRVPLARLIVDTTTADKAIAELRKKHELGKSITHYRCSICKHINRRENGICEKCGQPLKGMFRTIVLHPPGQEPPSGRVEETYTVSNHDPDENTLRKEIQDISWKLSGKHLKHLHENAVMCSKCYDAEAEKNIRKSS